MLALQLEFAGLMRLARKQRWLPLHVVMAGRAIRCGPPFLIFAGHKLPMMNVFVAVLALFVLNGLGEIVVLVALRTGEFRVPAVQRKLRPAVIEPSRWQARLPSARGVAALAGGRHAVHLGIHKRAFMRIRVAILASGESQSFIARAGFTRLGPMAFFAGSIHMQPGERELRAIVIETVRGLPRILRVAAQTLAAKLAFVFVLMTGETFFR